VVSFAILADSSQSGSLPMEGNLKLLQFPKTGLAICREALEEAGITTRVRDGRIEVLDKDKDKAIEIMERVTGAKLSSETVSEKKRMKMFVKVRGKDEYELNPRIPKETP
jgi:hypothetical protein